MWLAAFVVVYPIIAGGVLALHRDEELNEIYPIAPWALFCFTPNEEVDFGIRLRYIDGQPLDEPVYFEQLGHLPDANKIIAYGLIQQWGRQASAGVGDEWQPLRARFEQEFLRGTAGQVQYELVQRRFDVLERRRAGIYREVSVLHAFFRDAAGDAT